MRHFERIKLRRMWGKISGGYIYRRPNNEGRDKRPACDADEDKHSSDQENGKPEKASASKTTDVIMCGFTGALLLVAWLQKDITAGQSNIMSDQTSIQDRQANIAENQLTLGNRQYDFTANQAEASERAADASFKVSQKAATAAADTAAAMKQMALAGARQAETAAKELAIRQRTDLEVWIVPEEITPDKRLEAELHVLNRGEYTVPDVKAHVGSIFVRDEADIPLVWQLLQESVPFDSVPKGKGDRLEIPIAQPIGEKRRQLIDGELILVLAASVVAKDGAGKLLPPIRRCQAIYGIPTRLRHTDCQHMK